MVTSLIKVRTTAEREERREKRVAAFICQLTLFSVNWKNCDSGGIPDAVIAFNKFLAKLPHKHKVVIAGNHEVGFNDMTVEYIQV